MADRRGIDPLEACPHVTGAFELLGRRWTGPLLDTLAKRPARFSELRVAVRGISDRMLGERLRELIDAGLVVHYDAPSGPAYYQLTDDGRDLAPALEQIRRWWKDRAPYPT